MPACQLFHHQDPVGRVGDNTTRGGGRRIQRKAIRLKITDKRGGRTTVVDGVRQRSMVLAWGTTKEVKGNKWVHRRRLGADSGGGGGWQIRGSGRGGGIVIFFFRMRHVFVGSEVRRLGVL